MKFLFGFKLIQTTWHDFCIKLNGKPLFGNYFFGITLRKKDFIMADASVSFSPQLSLDTTVVAETAAISTDLDGEVVILDTNKGVYYGLDAVGASIWGLIQQPNTLREVRDAILQEYDVDTAVCERDLMALVANLASNSLVSITASTVVG